MLDLDFHEMQSLRVGLENELKAQSLILIDHFSMVL
jgi:hypothetical protein